MQMNFLSSAFFYILCLLKVC